MARTSGNGLLTARKDRRGWRWAMAPLSFLLGCGLLAMAAGWGKNLRDGVVLGVILVLAPLLLVFHVVALRVTRRPIRRCGTYFSTGATLLAIGLSLSAFAGNAAERETTSSKHPLLDLIPAEFRQSGRLPDGSTVSLEAVSFGIYHRVPGYCGGIYLFKSAAPTLMLTTRRTHIPEHFALKPPSVVPRPTKGRFITEIWTRAIGVDAEGREFRLRARIYSRAISGDTTDEGRVWFGAQPNEMAEIWEFVPSPNVASAGKNPSLVRVRVYLTRWGEPQEVSPPSSNQPRMSPLCCGPVSSGEKEIGDFVEFVLPNGAEWRTESAQNEARFYRPARWLGREFAFSGDNLPRLREIAAELAREWPKAPRMLEANPGALQQALMLACQNGRLDAVRWLVEAQGAAANGKRNESGWSPLTMAATQGRHAIALYLLQRGADPNRPDDQGLTPLLRGAPSGPEMVRLLIAHGARAHIGPNDEKWTQNEKWLIRSAQEWNLTPEKRLATLKLLRQAGVK